ncbi:unnamed protein product [Arabis nemorensis]|uniref:HMA domain-containing protein n=1 Tax=Arabis nemorensis TaxID=586526 RepID=A0A565BHC0_9BRAS|nr:unnamed protein product [Arabis nemorensis]
MMLHFLFFALGKLSSETSVVAVELKIGMHCEKCAKKFRKVVFKLDGVQDCVTDIYNQKVMVGGEFSMEKLLKVLKKKTGKKAEILIKTEKYDDQSEAETIPENNEDSETGQQEEEIIENNDKQEPRLMEVEYNIPFPDKYQVDIAKVMSKFKEMDKAMGINSNPDSDEEREMLAKYMMLSDANPNNACSIS